MIQIINTIIVGMIIYNILSKKDKYKELKLNRIIIISFGCLMYFVIYGISANFITLFGPGAFLVSYSYWEHYKKKRE
ncbi:hypothetical protein [Paenibacillus endoradicis]|uniref:hypothetical protein n=1 Tax=Paenibacillus endoradicis TaxID=2972487 RepID=UPI0021591234|nr:hypothetical protein [Paenibacillus endoradicis]MCR8656702.1 hypothetical protein [Paenibacillus endoradicis]